MVEVIRFPSIFQTWESTAAIIRKHLEGQMPPEEAEEVLARFRDVYDRLPSSIGDVSIPLNGLERLTEKEVDAVYSALGFAMDQIQEELQSFAGQVLGEIFALVLECSRAETRSEGKASA